MQRRETFTFTAAELEDLSRLIAELRHREAVPFIQLIQRVEARLQQQEQAQLKPGDLRAVGGEAA